MKIIKYLLLTISIIALLVLGHSCNDSDRDYQNNGLTLMPTNKSFTLLAMNMEKAGRTGNPDVATISAYLKTYNPQVTLLKGVYSSADEDFATNVAYTNSMDEQARQGYFSSEKSVANSKSGAALFVTNTFTKTGKQLLDNGLTLHTMDYTLIAGDIVMVATCSLDKTDNALAKKQAETLVRFASTVNKNFMLAVSTTADVDSDILNTLRGVYKQSCEVIKENTYPVNEPTKRTQYIFTPKNQPWGVKYAAVVGNAEISDHKGLYLRIGLTN